MNVDEQIVVDHPGIHVSDCHGIIDHTYVVAGILSYDAQHVPDIDILPLDKRSPIIPGTIVRSSTFRCTQVDDRHVCGVRHLDIGIVDETLYQELGRWLLSVCVKRLVSIRADPVVQGVVCACHSVAVLLAYRLGGPDLAVTAGFGAFAGHCFPVWLGFRGGKGVATFLGVLLGLAWPVMVAAAAIWIGVLGLAMFWGVQKRKWADRELVSVDTDVPDGAPILSGPDAMSPTPPASSQSEIETM